MFPALLKNERVDLATASQPRLALPGAQSRPTAEGTGNVARPALAGLRVRSFGEKVGLALDFGGPSSSSMVLDN